MERKIYEPTEKQLKNWSELQLAQMPTDDELRASWKKSHHGKEAGWGLGKRNWIIGNLGNCQEYQMGLWQGRVDRARGLDYQEKHISDENANAYNLGYYRGYTDYESNRHGWDAATRQRFDEKYLS